jgi:hypothetical protein
LIAIAAVVWNNQSTIVRLRNACGFVSVPGAGPGC